MTDKTPHRLLVDEPATHHHKPWLTNNVQKRQQAIERQQQQHDHLQRSIAWINQHGFTMTERPDGIIERNGPPLHMAWTGLEAGLDGLEARPSTPLLTNRLPMTPSRRTIRFRVWDGKDMHYAPLLRMITSDDFEGSSGLGTHFSAEQGAVLLETTGIADANSQTIYEGDLYLFKEKTYSIEYVDGAFWIVNAEHGPGQRLLAHSQGGLVIGNLLEAKHDLTTNMNPLQYFRGAVVRREIEPPLKDPETS
jgi:hypothetical protein